MTITFNSVIPKPLASTNLEGSQVWKADFELVDNGHYLINASSGKGKSTFINLLYGLRQDYSGEILFGERQINTFDDKEWAQVRTNELAIVFQGLELFPNVTVLDNLLIKNELTNFKTEQEIKRFLEALEVDSLMHKQAATLSMGQQQRVAIVRALCQPFNCLLLDEPFSHLDTVNAQKAWQLIHSEANLQGAKTITTTLGDDHQIKSIKTLLL